MPDFWVHTMKTRLFPVALAAFALAASLATAVHARPIADSTGVQALTGVKTQIDRNTDKANQLESQIGNQGGYDKPWTAYFLGQRKCDDQFCFDIDGSGQVRVSPIDPIGTSGITNIPIGIAPLFASVHLGNACAPGGREYTIAPTLTSAQRLAGSVPSGWNISYSTANTRYNDGGCGM